MNFFRLIFLVLIVITFSQKVMSDSHDQNIVEKAKEINKQVKEKQASQQENIKKETGQIVVQEEPLPLNDPFAGDASTVSNIVTEVTPTSSAVKLRSYKLVGSFSAKDNSFITLVDDNGEFMTVELFEEVLSGVKLVDVSIKRAVFEKADDNQYIIMNFKNQIKEANEF
tara:strand:+ start:383 stop:889 length:507 start_codon:yes stop_codon:yes gene_type:complete